MVVLKALFFGGKLSVWEKIVTWYQNSVLYEIFAYLGERYFTVEFGAYENFSLDAGAGVTARNLIFAVAFGLVVASAMTAHVRNGLGDFVRALLKTESFSPESAKTLEELDYFRNTSVRRELTRGSVLRMVVRCREEEEWQAASPERKDENYTIDFTSAHFYIPEELRYRADVRFDKVGSGWRPVLAVALFALLASAALCWLLPDVLRLADNLISFMAPA